MDFQEWIALLIVAIACFTVFRAIWKQWAGSLVARWFLNHGKIKWAMRLQFGKGKSSPLVHRCPDD